MARRKISQKKIQQESPIYANYVDRLESKVQSNQSKLSMILGALIILVVGILVFNYFNRQKPDLGPAQQTEVENQYTVKEGDTLFEISEKYYGDGYKYPEIAKVNNLTNPDQIEKGQVLQIPKLEGVTAEAPSGAAAGSKGAPDITMLQPTGWGPPITEGTYTVVKGDWLSKIAGRAYGDIYAYDRIAKANNIPNPDIIEPDMVLTIPR